MNIDRLKALRRRLEPLEAGMESVEVAIWTGVFAIGLMGLIQALRSGVGQALQNIIGKLVGVG